MPLISPRSFQTDAGALARLVSQAQSFVLREQDVRSALAQQSRVNIQNERRLRLAEQAQITGNINRIFDVQREDEQQDFENQIRLRQIGNQEAGTRSLIEDRKRRAAREAALAESMASQLGGDFGSTPVPLTRQKDPDLPSRPVGGTGVAEGGGVITTAATGVLPPSAQQGGPTGALFPPDQFMFSEGTIRRPRDQEEVQLNLDEEARLVAQRAILDRQRIPKLQSTRGIPSGVLQTVLARQTAANKVIDDQLAQIDAHLQNLRNIPSPQEQRVIKTSASIRTAETAIATAEANGDATVELIFGIREVPIGVARDMLAAEKGIATPRSTTPVPIDFNGTPTGRQVLEGLRGKQRPGR